MVYFADTANITEIKELISFFPLAGVTTNPTLLKREGKSLSKIIPEILDCLGNRKIHIQLASTTASEMLKEALQYVRVFHLPNLYAKVPVTREGYRAIPKLKAASINVTATSVFTLQQALIAARAGADYVAPYVNRLDINGGDGIALVSEIVKSFQHHGLITEVLAASFKNADQVYMASLTGCHAITASYEVLTSLINHPLTDKSVDDFKRDAEGIYDIAF